MVPLLCELEPPLTVPRVEVLDELPLYAVDEPDVEGLLYVLEPVLLCPADDVCDLPGATAAVLFLLAAALLTDEFPLLLEIAEFLETLLPELMTPLPVLLLVPRPRLVTVLPANTRSSPTVSCLGP